MPEAAHLLVLHFRAHLELTTREKERGKGGGGGEEEKRSKERRRGVEKRERSRR